MSDMLKDTVFIQHKRRRRKNDEPSMDDLKYIQDTLYVIGGKWKLSILLSLGLGNIRFRQIQRSIPGITPKILSKELKELELNHLVSMKIDIDTSIKTGYEVLTYCKSIDPMIKSIIKWGKQHRKVVTGS